jgi:DNA-binding SARP family transcriptional activator
VRRDTAVEALWPDTNPRRHTHALNMSTGRLRRAINRVTAGAVSDLIVHGDQRLRLDPDLVGVDVWRFQQASDAARAATDPTGREDAYRDMIAAYTGRLADGLETDWITAPRESMHRAATDAVSRLARLLVTRDPQQTVDLLDAARTWDPYNEGLYRDIMRLQAELGLTDGIARTLKLLAVRLAEISTTPSAETRTLAAGLQRRANADGRPASPDPPAPSSR